MENKSKNTSEISQWIDNYLHISLDTEEYVSFITILKLPRLSPGLSRKNVSASCTRF